MNGDLFSGKWDQVKGKIKEKWGKLTDHDLMRINGKREQMLGALKERYGWEKHRAEEELKRFEDHCRECCSKEKSSGTCCHGKQKGSCNCCANKNQEPRWDDKSKNKKAG